MKFWQIKLGVDIWRDCCGTVSVLSWYCFGNVLVLPRYCLGTLLVLSWYCFDTASVLAQYCRGTVSIPSWPCLSTVSVLSRYCLDTVLVLSRYYLGTGGVLFGTVSVLARYWPGIVSILSWSGEVLPALACVCRPVQNTQTYKRMDGRTKLSEGESTKSTIRC